MRVLERNKEEFKGEKRGMTPTSAKASPALGEVEPRIGLEREREERE